MEQERCLLSFWKRLQQVKTVRIRSRSHAVRTTGWDRQGRAVVQVCQDSPRVFIFKETGNWDTGDGFTNAWRWELEEGRVSLAHLHWDKSPVFLFHLVPASSHRLQCVDGHKCCQDRYKAEATWDDSCVHIHWTVVGPVKNEEVDFLYT